MLKKILTISLILLLALTVVSAADINNMKMPKDFQSAGSGMYNQQSSSAGGTGFNAAVSKYSDTDFKDWTTDDPTDNFKVNKKGDYYTYTDSVGSGVVEVVEIDGEKFIVVFSSTHKGDAGKCIEFMSEFNKLNNVKPVTV